MGHGCSVNCGDVGVVKIRHQPVVDLIGEKIHQFCETLSSIIEDHLLQAYSSSLFMSTKANRNPEIFDVVSSYLCNPFWALRRSQAPHQRDAAALSTVETLVLLRSRHQPIAKLIGENIHQFCETLSSTTEGHLVLISLYRSDFAWNTFTFLPSCLGPSQLRHLYQSVSLFGSIRIETHHSPHYSPQNAQATSFPPARHLSETISYEPLAVLTIV